VLGDEQLIVDRGPAGPRSASTAALRTGQDVDMEQICADLLDEHHALDRIVGALSDAQWELATPADGWSVRDSISHLWFFDQRAYLALTDPDAFALDKAELMASGRGTDPSVDRGREISSDQLLTQWRADAAQLLDVARRTDPATRVPWYGPSMGARSFITARLMESWAHGQDIVDTVGATRAETHRLRHVAHIGVSARPFSYLIRGCEVPEGAVHVALTPPEGGEPWTWNDPSSPHRVTGPAIDFCLLVTQRRNIADLRLVAEGELATDWLAIAQAFAGAPGAGRPPLAT
jgi:uncharacterized protein (TIGR03084 family)